MQNAGDTLVLNLEDKAALAEYLGRKEDGEECVFVVRTSKNEQTEKTAEFSIHHIKVEHKKKDGADKEALDDEAKETEGLDETEPVLEWARDNMKEKASARSGY